MLKDCVLSAVCSCARSCENVLLYVIPLVAVSLCRDTLILK